jgi:hypothetical protein
MSTIDEQREVSQAPSPHTPTPWDWLIHDHTMASLGVMPDPGLGNPLVLAIGPCPSCADRAQPREWKWGRCHTPSEADAAFIVRAVNSHDALVKALEGMVEMYADLVNSGDAGFWDPEKVDEVKHGRAALAAAKGEA